MNDMTPVIQPKSDQLNSDSLMAGPRTITITRVDINPGTEQPVIIHYENDDGKPWKPCKSMARCLVAAWGPDAKKYVGRSVTLYRDPTVKWAGMEVGGIRVSHMSHIDGTLQLMLTATRGSRKPHKVLPLKLDESPRATSAEEPTEDKAAKWTDGYLGKVAACTKIDELMELQSKSANTLAKLKDNRPELHELTVNAGTAKAKELQSEGAEFAE